MFPIVLAAALSVAAVPSPRDHDGWVSDTADVIDAGTEARIETLLGDFERKSGVEIAVVTADDVDGEPHAWGTALFDRWGIGKARSDNGLLLLLVMGQRDVEIITGTGIEAALPDDWIRDLEGDAMVPAFKLGKFGEGIEAALVEIVDHLASTSETGAPPPRPAPAAPAPQPAVAPSSSGGGGGAPWLPIGLGGGGLAAAVGLGVLARRRRWLRMSTCDECQQRMVLLDEIADDAKLDEGERAEERVGSIDYRVFVCPGCQWTRIVPRNRWFSGYRRCTQCSYKTTKRSSETVVAATYDHGGEIRITERCANCNHVREWTERTSRRTRPSSGSSFHSSGSRSSSGGGHSSGGSRSSFGGGHSRGGGAGSHW